MDTFRFQQRSLLEIVRGEAAGGVDDAVAGEIGIGGSTHDAAHQAGMIGPAT